MDSIEEALNQLASKDNGDGVKNNIEGFKKLIKNYLDKSNKPFVWDNIQKLPDNAIIDYDSLDSCTDKDKYQSLLNKIVVVKLNGGLGTSMGCTGPKSVIEVRKGQNFLDLTIKQIEHMNTTYNVNIPLILMNSFNTEEDTLNEMKKYIKLNVHIFTFNQSCYPRIHADTLLPVPTNANVFENIDAWYPPGHGDFYISFKNSGLLDKFIAAKKEYCFLSNIDNLGATLDQNIINYLLKEDTKDKHEFAMELTNKTKADVKGGTLIQYEDKLQVLEIAQVPKEHVEEFKSVKIFKYFNTNNLWLRLDAIDRVLKEDKLQLGAIPNAKSLKNGTKIIQLEQVVGDGMRYFNNAVGINVPRSRFLPVKKCSDLLLIMSNFYNEENGTLVISPNRMFPGLPSVKLGDEHFAKVNDFLKRFEAIPDLLELDHLTVVGDIRFGKGVSLRGTVIVIANKGRELMIPTGSILENKIISGNLPLWEY